MGMGQNSVAAATAVVGYDLALNQTWKVAGVDRALSGFAICGSAAALDTLVEILIDNVSIGQFYNTATGACTQDHFYLLDNYVPAGSNITIVVRDAPGTNPINIVVTWDEM